MLSFFAFFLPTILLCLALYTNKDLFTPAKFFVAYMFLFHFELVYIDYNLEFYLTYFCLLILASCFVVFEATFPNFISLMQTDNRPSSLQRTYLITIFSVWILSSVPIAVQFYFISISGGIVQYAIDVIYRAEVWRGKGALIMIIQTMMILNLIYFAAGIYWNKKSKKWWFAFFIHFGFTIMVALLTGSRSVILMNVIFMALLYHYVSKPLRLRYVLTGFIFLAISLTVLGLARNNFSWDEDGITTGITASPDKLSIATSTFRSGLIPLTLVYSKEPPKIQNGTSLITPISNIVPRDIWPKKPDTSSIAMNKQYVEDRGLGPYEYPTGIIGLGIMNFGWIIGIPFSFILLSIIFIFVEVSYKHYVVNPNRQFNFNSILFMILSLYFIQTLPALVVGEFTNVIHGVLLTKFFPIFLFLFLIWSFNARPRSS